MRTESAHYFGEGSVMQHSTHYDGISANHGIEVRGYNLKQSQRLPRWIWFLVAKSLGIKTHPRDRPWFGTALYVITLTLALTSSCSTIWYLVYDILNEHTRQTVLTGSTLCLVVVYWCAMCIYANKLAYKLLTNKKMLMSVRMHSKTLFKVNTAILMTILAVTFASLNNYQSAAEFEDATCRTVNLTPVVCKLKYVSRVGLSVLGLTWNLLVGVVVLSVCRTHTIGEWGRKSVGHLNSEKLVDNLPRIINLVKTK